ncbi:hypothetical protein CDLVIII_5150 [Clostridium sp. DL-VIII]|uniref:hypothetical protein n=1 Tax=Clostridium sp. DL-VIII TaxID=641107 RepID=UPI00023B07D9|nr:hypothetical protein [Clostridium sp. DL-VIII]EHJ01641.1 hypothetical protein CDLVIII_5150 [Clostridium sp. DL-VIII]
MSLFSRSRLKVKNKEDGNKFKSLIEYYEIEQKDEFNVNVLKELIGNNLCLGVIDSKLLYNGAQEESEITFEEIIERLDSIDIVYKKIEIKKIPEISMFGLTIKKGSKKTDKDYIIGFVVNKDNFKDIEKYINKLNIYYFIDKTGLCEEALLQKLERNYEDIDEIGNYFCCQIFNNNFMNQLIISSEIELASEIKEVVNRCYLELK